MKGANRSRIDVVKHVMRPGPRSEPRDANIQQTEYKKVAPTRLSTFVSRSAWLTLFGSAGWCLIIITFVSRSAWLTLFGSAERSVLTV